MRLWARRQSHYRMTTSRTSPPICTACPVRWWYANKAVLTEKKPRVSRGFFSCAGLPPLHAFHISRAVRRRAVALRRPYHFTEALHYPVMRVMFGTEPLRKAVEGASDAGR